eukprot:TRINITY_DN274_c0_g4_i1.p1 TRINITY_DN274_c0_g4~~TRINITY_DN274_c0_g4_i1.p1  ORF type:complete len:167 (+),score=30.98 TRINITY_DN274_c0_g4_i1:408-908(+)
MIRGQKWITWLICCIIIFAITMFILSNSTDKNRGDIRVYSGRMNCEMEKPLSKERVGWMMWSVFHTFASSYPETSYLSDGDDYEIEKIKLDKFRSFLDAFVELFPCTDCSSHFKEMMERTPPNFQVRAELEVWLCERHNEVNERLGRKVMPCDLDFIRESWKQKSS